MSADDNASEQAREVEAVRCVLREVGDQSPTATIRRVLAALAPIRAAERQEAAREALSEAASTVTEEMFGGRGDDVRLWLLAISRQQQRRADGVTGRSGT